MFFDFAPLADTTMGAAGSDGSSTVGLGDGWRDTEGRWRRSNGFATTEFGNPGDTPVRDNVVYRYAVGEKMGDGALITVSDPAGRSIPDGGGGVARYSPENGGSGIEVTAIFGQFYVFIRDRGTQLQYVTFPYSGTLPFGNILVHEIADVDSTHISHVFTIYPLAPFLNSSGVFNPNTFNYKDPRAVSGNGAGIPVGDAVTPFATQPYSQTVTLPSNLFSSRFVGLSTYNSQRIKSVSFVPASVVLTKPGISLKKVGKDFFSAEAVPSTGGSGTKSYQYKKDGQNYGAATPTAQNLDITGLTATNPGASFALTLTVTDDSGSMTSDAAIVRLLDSDAEILSDVYNSRGTSDQSPGTMNKIIVDKIRERNPYKVGEGVNLSVSGSTTADWVANSTAHLNAMIAAGTTRRWITGCINDFKKNALTLAQSKFNIDKLITDTLNAGIGVLLRNEFGTHAPESVEFGPASEVNAKVAEINAYVASKHNGTTIIYVDTDTVALADSVYPSGWTDTLHLQTSGKTLLGNALATNPAMLALIPDASDTNPPGVAVASLSPDGLTVNIDLDENGTGATGFTVKVNGSTRSATNWHRSTATRVVGTLASVASDTDTLTISYDETSGNVIDGAGNRLVSFTNTPVVNNSGVTAGEGGSEYTLNEIAAAVAARILMNPANPLYSDAQGFVRSAAAVGLAIDNADLRIDRLTLMTGVTYYAIGREIMAVKIEASGRDMPALLLGQTVYLAFTEPGVTQPPFTITNGVIGGGVVAPFWQDQNSIYVRLFVGTESGGEDLPVVELEGAPTGKDWKVWMLVDGVERIPREVGSIKVY